MNKNNVGIVLILCSSLLLVSKKPLLGRIGPEWTWPKEQRSRFTPQEEVESPAYSWYDPRGWQAERTPKQEASQWYRYDPRRLFYRELTQEEQLAQQQEQSLKRELAQEQQLQEQLKQEIGDAWHYIYMQYKILNGFKKTIERYRKDLNRITDEYEQAVVDEHIAAEKLADLNTLEAKQIKRLNKLEKGQEKAAKYGMQHDIKQLEDALADVARDINMLRTKLKEKQMRVIDLEKVQELLRTFIDQLEYDEQQLELSIEKVKEEIKKIQNAYKKGVTDIETGISKMKAIIQNAEQNKKQQRKYSMPAEKPVLPSYQKQQTTSFYESESPIITPSSSEGAIFYPAPSAPLLGD